MRLRNFLTILLLCLIYANSVSAWSNTYTHPWFCEQSIKKIWGNDTFEQNSNVTECSTRPDLIFHDTAKHHCYKTCPVNSTYYCGDPTDCPAYDKTLEWFEKARNESNLNQKLCDFCIGTHYCSDMQVPFHQIRYEDQSCHSSYESKAETRISQPEKYGNWSFTTTCNGPPANFTLTYQEMLGFVDKIVEQWNVVPNTTTTTTTSTTTTSTTTTTSPTSTITTSTTSTTTTTTSTTTTTTQMQQTTTTSSTTTTIVPTECSKKGDKPPCNGIVDDFELLAYIDQWAKGLVGDFDLLEATNNWAMN